MGSLTGAVLFLRTPPDGVGLSDWYLKKITGVPFLMLNALNLQRGGVQRLIVYYPDLAPQDRQRLCRQPFRRGDSQSARHARGAWCQQPLP